MRNFAQNVRSQSSKFSNILLLLTVFHKEPSLEVLDILIPQCRQWDYPAIIKKYISDILQNNYFLHRAPSLEMLNILIPQCRQWDYPAIINIIYFGYPSTNPQLCQCHTRRLRFKRYSYLIPNVVNETIKKQK